MTNYNECLFQFYKVRLKPCWARPCRIPSWTISILQSSIKTPCTDCRSSLLRQFQFYKVRLKLKSNNYGCNKNHRISILQSSIKTGELLHLCRAVQISILQSSIKTQAWRHQKGVNVISILQSSIKTEMNAPLIYTPKYFNSTKFD